jgi:hypothetical protein
MNQFEKIEDEMHDRLDGPKQAKGGVFAPTDIELIKKALTFYVSKSLTIEDWEERQLSNLMHRLNRI